MITRLLCLWALFSTPALAGEIGPATPSRSVATFDTSNTLVVFWSMSDPASVMLLQELDQLREAGWCALAIHVDNTNQASQIRPFLFRMGLQDLEVRRDPDGTLSNRFAAHVGDVIAWSSGPAPRVAWRGQSLDHIEGSASHCSMMVSVR